MIAGLLDWVVAVTDSVFAFLFGGLCMLVWLMYREVFGYPPGRRPQARQDPRNGRGRDTRAGGPSEGPSGDPGA